MVDMTRPAGRAPWRDFLDAHIRRADDLEVLLLLHGAQEPLEAEDIADRLPGVPQVPDVLHHLVAQGLVRAVAPHRFGVRSIKDVTSGLATVRRLYTRDRVRVLRVLNANAIERIRRDAAQLLGRSLGHGKGRNHE
jgi:hypothetical protein